MDSAVTHGCQKKNYAETLVTGRMFFVLPEKHRLVNGRIFPQPPQLLAPPGRHCHRSSRTPAAPPMTMWVHYRDHLRQLHGRCYSNKNINMGSKYNCSVQCNNDL